MNELKAITASWGRSFLAAVLAMYMGGITDPGKLALGGLAAIAPVIIRWLNPKDVSFGVQGK